MENIRKKIIMVDENGQLHNIRLKSADITHDGEVVISYRDYFEGSMHDSFAEIVNANDNYYIKPTKKVWNYYSCKFNSFDSEKSNEIIEKIQRQGGLGVYDISKGKIKKINKTKKNNDELSTKTLDMCNTYFISCVFLTENGSVVDLKDVDNLKMLFFEQPYISRVGNPGKKYKKTDIDIYDKDEIRKLLIGRHASGSGKFDITEAEEPFEKFITSSRNIYHISFSFCENTNLFELISNFGCSYITINDSEDTVPLIYDDLTSALHRQLPITIGIDNGINNREITFETVNSGTKKTVSYR